MNEYKVVSRDAGKIEVRAVTQTTTHKIVDAMAEFALLGESAPKGGEPLEDVFGGSWDD